MINKGKLSNVKIEPNSKPHIINRIISGLIDACIVFMVFTGIYMIFLNTPISDSLYRYDDEKTVIYDSLLYSTGMGVKNYEFEEDTTYRIYTDDDGKEFVIEGIASPSEDATQEEWDVYTAKYIDFHDKLEKDASYATAETNYKLVNFGLIALDALIVESIFYLAIPLIDKKRRTIGKMIAKTQLYSAKHKDNPKWYQMVGRFVWILLFESLIPYVFLSQATFVATAFITFVFVICNRDNKAFHDLVSGTMVITTESFESYKGCENNIKNEVESK